MVETLVSNGDKNDYVQAGIDQADMYGNTMHQIGALDAGFERQRVPYRGRVDILAGRAGVSGMLDVEDPEFDNSTLPLLRKPYQRF